ncbi:MAG: RHS repeat domain-containing protein [Bacteroidota bacterium]
MNLIKQGTFIWASLFGLMVTAQDGLQDLIPPSPTAASLGTYADYPVSKYSGVPNISIPLTSIDMGGFSLPVSLSYHASGIRVAQEASWVGLGWALNAGGVISRQVRGKDDFDGWLVDPVIPAENDNQAIIDYFTYYSDPTIPPVLDNDGEPDIFTFNFGGYSGKFIMTKSGETVILDPQSELRIQNVNELIWRITDPNGVLYTFARIEETQAFLSSGSQPDEFTWPANEQVPYISSWYLSEIELPSKEKINLYYTDIGPGSRSTINISHEQKDLIGWSVMGEQEYIDELNAIWNNTVYDDELLCNFNYVKEVYHHSASITKHELHLNRISWPTGSIIFDTSDREDLDYETSAPQKLDQITIWNKDQNRKIRSFQFSYSHFNEEYENAGYRDKYLNMRLRLDSLTERGAQDEPLPPHVFTYNARPLPEKTSSSTDLWGFYNGKNNTVFSGGKLYIPEYRVTVNLEEFGWKPTSRFPEVFTQTASNLRESILPGADKESDVHYMTSAILEKIKYPTGGTTEFEFEPNSYYNLVEEYQQELVTLEALACNGSACNRYEFQTPPQGSATSESFFISELTPVKMSFLSSNFLGDCSNFVAPDPAVEFGYLERQCPDGSFDCPILTFTYGDFANSDCSELGYPNYSYNDYEVTLEPGWYRMHVTPFSELEGEMILSYYIDTVERVLEKEGGGLRVSKIKSDAVERSFLYEDEKILDGETVTVSSGRLLSEPNGVYLEQQYGYCISPLDNTDNGDVAEPYLFLLLARTSDSYFPLSGFKSGNSIGYDRVLEVIDGPDGKSIMEKTFYNTEEVQTLPFFPNLPNLKNGLPEYERYVANGITLREKEFKYEKGSQRAIRAMRYTRQILGFYEVDAEWWHPYETIETNYDQNGENPVVVTTDLEYNNGDHKMLTRSALSDSEGRTVVRELTYPSDPGSGAPAEMFDVTNANYKHILAPVVQEETTVDGTIVSEHRSNFVYDTNKEMVLLQRSEVRPRGGTDIYGVDFGHDDLGRVVQQIRDGGTPSYYIWGYQGQYPIAKIENFGSDDIDTGLQTLITVAMDTADEDNDRTMDLYDQNGNRLYAGEEGSLREAFENLRNALPPGALMTSYTYDPLIGMTSMTNPRGYTTYYEYDDFNRLQAVKDAQGNRMTDYQYHYQQRP